MMIPILSAVCVCAHEELSKPTLKKENKTSTPTILVHKDFPSFTCLVFAKKSYGSASSNYQRTQYIVDVVGSFVP